LVSSYAHKALTYFELQVKVDFYTTCVFTQPTFTRDMHKLVEVLTSGESRHTGFSCRGEHSRHFWFTMSFCFPIKSPHIQTDRQADGQDP